MPIRKFLDCKHSRQRIGRALDSKGNSKLLRLAFLIVPPRLQAFADRQQEREANERETPQGRVFFFFLFFSVHFSPFFFTLFLALLHRSKPVLGRTEPGPCERVSLKYCKAEESKASQSRLRATRAVTAAFSKRGEKQEGEGKKNKGKTVQGKQQNNNERNKIRFSLSP